MITFDEFKNDIIYYFLRLIFVFCALYLGYNIVNSIIVPKVLEPICLSNTENCVALDIYQYQNTFLAKENISQLWFWYNGTNLYIYGQVTMTCKDPDYYTPVNVFTLEIKGNDINFTPFANQCITKLQTVINYYEITLKIEKKTIYLNKYDNESYTTNIYDIIKSMKDNNILSL